MISRISAFLSTHVVWLMVIACLIGGGVYWHYRTPSAVIVHTNEHTTTVTVDHPVLTEKIITKYLTNPKDKQIIAGLLAENAQLQLQTTAVTDTTGDLHTSGSGVIVAEPFIPLPGASALPAVPGVTNYHFKDWRLDFSTDLKTAHYDLAQKFVVFTTTGKDAAGKAATLVQLYEIGSQGERTLIPTDTTALFADATATHWFVSFHVQAGFAGAGGVPGGIIGFQWLGRGRTSAPGDTRWAVATPVAFLASALKEIGVLPVSFNLGSIPKQPFTNLWVSPYIGWNATGRSVGGSVTATF